MSINNLPTALQPAIQQGWLEQDFQEGLSSTFKFRSAATRQPFPNGIGETITKTRTGLLAPVTTYMNGAGNTNLDNGLTPSGYALEQYTASLNMFAASIDLNVETSAVAIASVFLENAKKLGIQAAQSMDRQAQKALYNAGFSGNSRMRVANATVNPPIDDVRGFQTVMVNGVPTPVSAGNPLTVTINGNSYTVTNVAVDGSNVSSVAAFGGISGVLTTTVAVAAGDGTLNAPVIAATATTVLRPNGRLTTAALVAGDALTMSNLLDATATLRGNAVPGFEGGAYVIFLDPYSMRAIFKDPDFKTLYQGDSMQSSTFANGVIYKLAGLIFVVHTDTATQALNGLTVRRPLVVGEGCLLEMIAESMMIESPASNGDIVNRVDGVKLVTRAPLDRLNQIIAQSWFSIFAYVCPTDTSVLASVIPTASNAAYKRIVMLEHVA